MTTLTTSLSVQHADHKPRIDELRQLADGALDSTPIELAADLDHLLDFLTSTLLAHLAAEEAELYPAVADVTGPGTAALLRADHDDIRRRIGRLHVHRDELASPLLPVARRELVGDLYELHAVLTRHIAQEEEILFPQLERSLAAERTDAIAKAMRRSVALEQQLADGLVADGG